MSGDNVTMIVILVVLIAISAFFSASETAYTSLNRIRLKSKADGGDKRAASTLRLVDKYDKLLSTLLVGNNIVNISASSLATVFFVQGLQMKNGAVISTVVVTIAVLIFGEISPKTLAKEFSEQIAMFTTPILWVLVTILTPVSFLFGQLQKALRKPFSKHKGDGITEEELVTMVDQAETEGGLDEHESELIRSAIQFNDLEASEILTPRVDIVAVEDTDDMDTLAKTFAESGYSRLPVFHEDIDDIIGVVHEKDFHNARYFGKFNLKEMTGSVLYTTGNTKISDLLRELQMEKTHMAVVVDEYGGTAGIVTMEDIVEELVGEIWDEHDEVIEMFKKQEDGSYIIACSADLTDMFDLFALKSESDANTVSGWVMEQVGRIPEVGDHFVADGLDVTVSDVDHRRVLEIRVCVLPREEV
ncbi:MAG: hemolysin family protein [Oscillospiraceae bacterium]|nr:hemolysin family protein [Oscillospiraceae bacterium]